MIMNFSKKNKGRVLKRVISVLLCVILCLGLIGCTKGSNAENLSSDDTLKQTGENIKEGSYKDKTSDVFFGYYGVSYDKYGFENWTKELYTSDYLNCIILNDVAALPEMKKYNVKVWLSADNAYYAAIECLKNNGTHDAYQKAIDDVYQKAMDTGAGDAWLGWYLDEPINLDAVELVSKYAQKYGKRFFAVFLINSTVPEVDGGFQVGRHISLENTQYLTDIACDNYWDVLNYADFHDKVYDTFHHLINPGTKVWYVAPAYANTASIKESEDNVAKSCYYSMRHLQAMYYRLRQEKDPGGLMCFAYSFKFEGEGLSQVGIKQVNEMTNNGWKDLEDLCKYIGRKICTGEAGL